MLTLYWMTFAPARKPYGIGFQFTHKNGDFGATSLTMRSCVALIKWRVTYRIGVHTISESFLCRHETLSVIIWISLICHKDDGNENVKRAIDWKDITTTCVTLFGTFLCHHWTITLKLKLPNLTFSGRRKRKQMKTNFSFSFWILPDVVLRNSSPLEVTYIWQLIETE